MSWRFPSGFILGDTFLAIRDHPSHLSLVVRLHRAVADDGHRIILLLLCVLAYNNNV